MKELIDQIEELYFLGGNLKEILKAAESYKPKIKKIYIPWTDMEVEIVETMRNKGYTYKEIAWELGREPIHVSQKIYYMGNRLKMKAL